VMPSTCCPYYKSAMAKFCDSIDEVKMAEYIKESGACEDTAGCYSSGSVAKNASQRQPRAGAPLLCILFRREKGVVMDVVYVSHFWHLSESESESVGDSEVPVWGRSGELVWGCAGARRGGAVYCMGIFEILLIEFLHTRQCLNTSRPQSARGAIGML